MADRAETALDSRSSDAGCLRRLLIPLFRSCGSLTRFVCNCTVSIFVSTQTALLCMNCLASRLTKAAGGPHEHKKKGRRTGPHSTVDQDYDASSAVFASATGSASPSTSPVSMSVSAASRSRSNLRMEIATISTV